MADDEKLNINDKIFELLEYSNRNRDSVKEKEISEESKNEVLNEIKNEDNLNTLIKLLQSNELQYRNIEKELRNIKEDKSIRKDKPLNLKLESIDNSLLCSNLISVLKETTESKKELKNNISKLKENEGVLIKEINTQKEKNHKLKESNNYCTITNDELLRIIQDQKIKIKNIMNKYEIEKEEKNKKIIENEELESLRKSGNMKIETLKKEIKILNEEIKFKVHEIDLSESLKLENEKLKREFDSKNIKLNERNNENYRLNKELKKLIVSDKKLKENIKKIKEKMDYNKKLYQTVSEENEWLNNEMSKYIELSGAEKKYPGQREEFNKQYKKNMTGLDEYFSNQNQEIDDSIKNSNYTEKELDHSVKISWKKKLKTLKSKLKSKKHKILNLQKNLKDQKSNNQDLLEKFIEIKKMKNNKKDEYIEELLSAYKKVNDDNLKWREKIIELERAGRKENISNQESNQDNEKFLKNRIANKNQFHVKENQFDKKEYNFHEKAPEDNYKLFEFDEKNKENEMKTVFQDCHTVTDTTIPEANFNFDEFFKSEKTDSSALNQKGIFDQKIEEYQEMQNEDVFKRNKNGLENIWNKIKHFNLFEKEENKVQENEIKEEKENVKQEGPGIREQKQDIKKTEENTEDLNFKIHEDTFQSFGNDLKEKTIQNEEKSEDKNDKHDIKQIEKEQKTDDHPVNKKVSKINNNKQNKHSNTLNQSKRPQTRTKNKITKKPINEYSSVSTDTSSSEFKQIKSKTSNLEKRFKELEEKLKKIKINKNGNIKDQIDAYNEYYYTEFVDLSGDSDII